jgi:hypothetical protein
MSNKQRQVFQGTAGSDQFPGTVGDAVAVEQGDLVALVSGLIVPASAFADSGTLAQNQEAFHDLFLGVSRSAHRATHDPLDGTAMDIATSGVFRFAITDSSAVIVGDFVGPEGSGAALAVGLENQKVVEVATANLAIGRVFKIVSATEVWVRIESVILTGGAQAMA